MNASKTGNKHNMMFQVTSFGYGPSSQNAKVYGHKDKSAIKLVHNEKGWYKNWQEISRQSVAKKPYQDINPGIINY